MSLSFADKGCHVGLREAGGVLMFGAAKLLCRATRFGECAQ